MRKNVRNKVSFGIWWVKRLKSRVGKGNIFHLIIPGKYMFQ